MSHARFMPCLRRHPRADRWQGTAGTDVPTGLFGARARAQDDGPGRSPRLPGWKSCRKIRPTKVVYIIRLLRENRQSTTAHATVRTPPRGSVLIVYTYIIKLRTLLSPRRTESNRPIWKYTWVFCIIIIIFFFCFVLFFSNSITPLTDDSRVVQKFAFGISHVSLVK